MAQHPSGAELVAAYDDAVYAADQAIRLTCIDGVQREDEIKARDTARSAIIALIDDPVRAADLELLEAWRLHVASGEVSDEVAVHWRAWNQLRAAIAKAQAPADAEGTK